MMQTGISPIFNRFAPMEHVLDNPAFNALISGNSNLSNGTAVAKYFEKEVSPFVAIKENTATNFQSLYETVPHKGPFVFISATEIEIPKPWETLQCIKCMQMVFSGAENFDGAQAEIVALTNAHIPKMLQLTALTNPGPFSEQTIDFGYYYGIFDGDKLIAMAGQRMNATPYAEISAVCTHPDYLGKGYAKQLLQYHATRIKAAAGVPFLHVRHDNQRAIQVYESMGFVTRKELYFYVLQKADKEI